MVDPREVATWVICWKMADPQQCQDLSVTGRIGDPEEVQDPEEVLPNDLKKRCFFGTSLTSKPM